MIENSRKNILDLIGKHIGRYHSCLLTCYSLNFSFFEERVLPVLRRTNIKNISIFADGKYLDTAQEHTSGKEFQFNKSYSFLPVYSDRGVFHPKIMLLVGKKHGLLIIGSGNITSAGLSTNDEIWGAFQLDNIDNENAPLFAAVWEYLQPFISQSYGSISQQMNWIRQYSPWLAELPKSEGAFELTSFGQKLSLHFVANKPENAIFAQLIAYIPVKGIQEITVISPYYDAKGELLQSLLAHYAPKNFYCVVDTAYGLLPEDLSPEIRDQICFHEWATCCASYNAKYNRLHAKMIHFKFEDGTEYLLLGSANATDAGMGTATKNAVNHEASIILRSETNPDWLKSMGIRLPQTPSIELPYSTSKNKNTLYPKEEARTYTTRIMYAELSVSSLSLFFKDKVAAQTVKVRLISRVGVCFQEIETKVEGNELKVSCEKPEALFKVCLCDAAGNEISNYSLVHRADFLLKCNPDPRQEKLDELFNTEYTDGDGLTDLLQYINSNWADEEEGNHHIKRGSAHSAANKGVGEQTHIYETLGEQDFNTASEDVLLKQTGELNHPSLRVADFLNIILSDNSFKFSADFEENEEQKLLEEEGQNINVPQNVIRKEREKTASHAEIGIFKTYLNKLGYQYSNQLHSFFEKPILTLTPSNPITLKNLSNILIALHLIQLYQGKKYTAEITTESNEKKQIEKRYVLEDYLKDFLINVYGEFLLLATAKFKSYEYDMLNQKLNHNRKLVFQKAIFLILNVHWSKSELPYRETLLLNTLYFIYPEKPLSPAFENEIKTSLAEMQANAAYISIAYSANKQYFEQLLPKYRQWLATYLDNNEKKQLILTLSPTNVGCMLFHSKLGFNHYLKFKTKGDSILVDLKREGYHPDTHICSGIVYPAKSIKY